MVKLDKIFLLILILCLSLKYDAPAQSPYFKTVQLLKSRQPISVTCIFQDSKGNLWLSTAESLMKYDGTDTYVFDQKDSLTISPVTAIGEDSLHQIWIGHKNGLLEYLVNNYFRAFKPEEGLGHSEISFIKFDSNGVLWFGTQGEGVYNYKGKNRKRIYNIDKEDGLNDNYVYTIAEGKNEHFYIGTDNGINIVNNQNKVIGVVSMKNGLPDNIVKHLEIDNDRLWVGMEEAGVCIYDIASGKLSLLASDWKFGTLNSFALNGNKECVVSTKKNGIIKIAYKENRLHIVKQFSTINGLPTDATQTIFSDREKNIWIATSKELVLSANSAFEIIDKKSEGFDYGSVFSFVTDKNGRYWAATQEGLISITKDNNGNFKYQQFLPAQSRIQNSFISLYYDAQGYIWAGTYGYGVYRINPDNLSFTKFDIQDGLADNNILYITGKGDSIWLATAGGGASLFDLKKKTFKNFNTANGLGSNYLYSIFIDSNNYVWFALDGKGTSVLKNGIIHNHILPDSLDVSSIYSINEDKSGFLWFLTSNKGILQYNKKSFTFYNEASGLLSNNVRSILADKTGNLVFAFNEGIQIYNPFVKGFETYGEDNGVAYFEPNLNGIYGDSSGNIWISGGKGIIKYNPSFFSQLNIQPKISINKILLFFNPFDKRKSKFNYDQNNFTFEYNGIWFQSAGNLKYRYKLQNYDYDWSLPTRSRSVTYSNLPPGKYTFSVEVSHRFGTWVGRSDAEFEFLIRPPFYKTWWFMTIVIIVIIVLIYYYIKAKTIKLQKAKDDLEVEVVKRTKTILQQKEEIQSQRDEIEAQRDFVIKHRDQIALQHEHITSNIQYASRIQNAILPPPEDFDLRLVDYFILNRPMDIVSGDFYWIASKNNRTFVAAADCTGHGVSGAFMSILGLSLLYKIINSNPDFSAAEVLNNLRDEIKYTMRQTGKEGEAQDGMDISLIILENNKQNYQFAGANNAGYLVRNNELLQLIPDKMLIGIFLFEESFKNQSGALYKDDIIYLSSDGYQDQFGGAPNSKFKSKPFRELLLKVSSLPMSEQKEVLNSTMNKWKGNAHLNDDILVIGFRIL